MPRNHEHRGLDLACPAQDAVERLADQDLRLDLDLWELLSQRLSALDVRLAELQQALVDDVVMQLFLLLELEDLRGCHGQDILDVAEDDVVVLDIEGRAHVQLGAVLLGHLERESHRLVAVR